MTDTVSTRSPEFLDEAERQVYAAIALGRRLLANPHPSRPIYELQLHQMLGDGFGLRIWAGIQDSESVQAWASVLDAPAVATPTPNRPQSVSYRVDGELDGVPIYVWTHVDVPITRATIASNSRGVRIVYTQGGTRRVLPQPNAAAARLWVAQHVTRPSAVSA